MLPCQVRRSSPAPAPRSGRCRARSPPSRPPTSAAVAIAAALERAGVSPDEVDHVDDGPGADGRPGPGAEPPGCGQGGHPDARAGGQRQQGLPVGPQRHLPRRPDDRRRRGRHRRRRRDGVDDERALPCRGRPWRLPVRQHRAARLDHRRWAVVRVRRLPDGSRHRALHGRRHQPRAAGRVRRAVARAGRQRDQGRPARRRDRAGVDPAAQG